jgi:hypothetical protein
MPGSAWTTIVYLYLSQPQKQVCAPQPALIDGGLINFLPGLTLNCNPPHQLELKASQDYRFEPTHSGCKVTSGCVFGLHLDFVSYSSNPLIKPHQF